MNGLTNAEIIAKMEKSGLIPVFNHQDSDTAIQVLINAYEAGIRVFEFTNRGNNSLEVFSQLVKVASDLDGLVLGIGTIWNLEQAERFLETGAQFIVSPALIPEMVIELESRGTLWIPGCGTVTEIHRAQMLGAGLIKIFPGNVLGPKFAKSVKSVLPEVKLMPTGGVKPTADNLSEWFDAGVICVGMGSQLFSKNLIKARNFAELQNEISDAVSLVKSVRDNLRKRQ